MRDSKSRPKAICISTPKRLNVLCYKDKQLIHLVVLQHEHRFLRVREKVIPESKITKYLASFSTGDIKISLSPNKMAEAKMFLDNLTAKVAQNVVTIQEAYHEAWRELCAKEATNHHES